MLGFLALNVAADLYIFHKGTVTAIIEQYSPPVCMVQFAVVSRPMCVLSAWVWLTAERHRLALSVNCGNWGVMMWALNWASFSGHIRVEVGTMW